MTGDWKYDRSKLRLKDRIDQKYNHERSVPLKFRTLTETLNPQPDAHVVFQRLLDFIERCDIASQLCLPRPEFKTLDGEAIFPEDDEPWWLTEVSKRISAEDRKGDEDGPVTEDEQGDEDERKDVGAEGDSCTFVGINNKDRELDGNRRGRSRSNHEKDGSQVTERC